MRSSQPKLSHLIMGGGCLVNNGFKLPWISVLKEISNKTVTQIGLSASFLQITLMPPLESHTRRLSVWDFLRKSLHQMSQRSRCNCIKRSEASCQRSSWRNQKDYSHLSISFLGGGYWMRKRCCVRFKTRSKGTVFCLTWSGLNCLVPWCSGWVERGFGQMCVFSAGVINCGTSLNAPWISEGNMVPEI